jgi:hypothetical protein
MLHPRFPQVRNQTELHRLSSHSRNTWGHLLRDSLCSIFDHHLVLPGPSTSVRNGARAAVVTFTPYQRISEGQWTNFKRKMPSPQSRKAEGRLFKEPKGDMFQSIRHRRIQGQIRSPERVRTQKSKNVNGSKNKRTEKSTARNFFERNLSLDRPCYIYRRLRQCWWWVYLLFLAIPKSGEIRISYIKRLRWANQLCAGVVKYDDNLLMHSLSSEIWLVTLNCFLYVRW